jgi:ABC-type polysaccharide/polyol phosphate export permease
MRRPDVIAQPVRLVEGDLRTRSHIWARFREVLRTRELLMNMIRKDLKVRYKNSALGFLWSMVNPALYLLVFYVVFTYFLPNNIPKFHLYLLAGLLPWALFSSSLIQSTGSVISNGDLIKKVYFPRELLPLSSIGAALFHFMLQLLVLAVFVIASRHGVSAEAIVLLPLALLAQLLVLFGFGLMFSSLNVKARDMQYLVELALLPLFWLTPIVYPAGQIAERLATKNILGLSLLDIYLANPLTRVVLAFQRGIYGATPPIVDGRSIDVLIRAPLSWYLQGIGVAALVGLVLIGLGWWIFSRLEGDFAEDL